MGVQRRVQLAITLHVVKKMEFFLLSYGYALGTVRTPVRVGLELRLQPYGCRLHRTGRVDHALIQNATASHVLLRTHVYFVVLDRNFSGPL